MKKTRILTPAAGAETLGRRLRDGLLRLAAVLRRPRSSSRRAGRSELPRILPTEAANMQVVMALPANEELEFLDQEVCGVPLLRRILATAVRSGGSRVLLVCPPRFPASWLAGHLQSPELRSVALETAVVDHLFDPRKADCWRAIAPRLESRFLWLPYDYIPHRRALSGLLAAAASKPDSPLCYPNGGGSGRDAFAFDRPAVLLKRSLIRGEKPRFSLAPPAGPAGIHVSPAVTVRQAEDELLRNAGKITDGIYSRFNRRLCAPLVRVLCRRRVSPNAVTLAGLLAAALAGLCFAHGSWPASVLGAVLFFAAGLLDESDGMVARLTFRDSAFGCWFETAVDYTTYLLLFAGIVAGGWRRGSQFYLPLGAALLGGSILSFLLVAWQRKLAAPAGRPNEFPDRYLAALEHDSGNLISRAVRQVQFLTKKSVFIHYVLLFTVLDLLPVMTALAAFGANVAWIVSLYLNRRLFSRRGHETTTVRATAVQAGK